MFDGNYPSEIMVTIATFNEPAKAKHLKTRLQEAGVKADVHNEGHLQQMAFMSKPQANAKVLVSEEDFERACRTFDVEGREDRRVQLAELRDRFWAQRQRA